MDRHVLNGEFPGANPLLSIDHIVVVDTVAGVFHRLGIAGTVKIEQRAAMGNAAYSRIGIG